jgi:hypothetical protein
VLAVVACHDHQLETAVVAIGAGDPVRVHDLDATRFLARSRHDPESKDSAVSPMLTTEGWSLYGAPWLQPVAISGKSRDRKNGGNKPKPLPSVATGCLRGSMVRRRKREPGVLIAAARFLPTMLARFPRRSQGVLTNYSPTSRAAVAQPRLQRRHVSPRRRGGRPSNEAAKGCKTFPVSVRDA